VGGIAMLGRLNRHSPDLFSFWRDFFVFFRAVIYLLIRSKIYQYIAHQEKAGILLKKSLPAHPAKVSWNGQNKAVQKKFLNELYFEKLDNRQEMG